MRDESRVTGRVDKIYLGVFVFGVGKVVIEGNFPFDRIFFVISNGRTFIDLSPACMCSGDVEQGTDELGFTRVAVSDHSQISDILRGK